MKAPDEGPGEGPDGGIVIRPDPPYIGVSGLSSPTPPILDAQYPGYHVIIPAPMLPE